jgi:hypothetical protein
MTGALVMAAHHGHGVTPAMGDGIVVVIILVAVMMALGGRGNSSGRGR